MGYRTGFREFSLTNWTCVGAGCLYECELDKIETNLEEQTAVRCVSISATLFKNAESHIFCQKGELKLDEGKGLKREDETSSGSA
jgi:hypothetical protein